MNRLDGARGARTALAFAAVATVGTGGAVGALGGLAAGCGGGEVRRLDIVLVAPDVEAGCGAPADAQRVELFALGDFIEIGESGAADAPLTTDRFPADTRALRLSLLGAGSVVRGLGRTGTLDLGGFADGGEVSVLVGPPRGFCQVGRLAQARRRPTVARAGAGLLVVGGHDAEGGPVGIAEWYDPARGVFELIQDAPFPDLRGAVAATLADGRVLIAWERGFQTYDPDVRTFGAALLQDELRPYAQTVSLGDGRVLVAGGCDDGSATPPCAASNVAAIWDPTSGEFSPGPPLAIARADGTAWLDGDGRVVLVGGVGADGTPAADVELWDPVAGGFGPPLASARAGAAAQLPAGGWIAGFAPAGAPEAAGATLIPPLGGAGGARATVAARAGATMTALDDGAVLVVGGVAAAAGPAVAEAELYLPHAARFELVPTSLASGVLGGRRHEHAAARLDDGSVLIVGGAGANGAADVRGDVWIYRHDIVGPWSSLPVQIFGFDGTPLVVPFDTIAGDIEPGPPAQLVVPAQDLRSGPLGGWTVLSGPTYVDVTLSVTLSAAGGAGAGAAAIFAMTSSGDYLALLLAPGQPVRVRAVTRGVTGPVRCESEASLTPDALAGAVHALSVERRAGTLHVELDGAVLLDCDDLPTTRGSVGVGVLGAPGASLRLGSLEAVR